MSRYEGPRRRAFYQQKGLCWYCARPMWERTVMTKAQAAVRWPNMTRKERAKIVCTAEHLKRLVDGGQRGGANVVAACAECNHNRHDADPEVYRSQRLREVWAI